MNLSECEDISDEAAASLAQHCPGLHTLDLSETKITDVGLASLGEGCRALMIICLNYLQTISDLPWGMKDEENMDAKVAQEVLDRDHYGLDLVKTRII